MSETYRNEDSKDTLFDVDETIKMMRRKVAFYR